MRKEKTARPETERMGMRWKIRCLTLSPLDCLTGKEGGRREGVVKCSKQIKSVGKGLPSGKSAKNVRRRSTLRRDLGSKEIRQTSKEKKS